MFEKLKSIFRTVFYCRKRSALRKLQQSAEPLERSSALLALLDLDGPQAVERLVFSLLTDTDAGVRAAAVSALEKTPNAASMNALATAATCDASPNVRKKALQAIRAADPQKASELAAGLLKDPDRGVAREALYITKAVEELLDFLRSGPEDLRHHAAGTLGSVGDGRAVDPLIDALITGSPELKCGAAKALGALAQNRAVDPLIAALGDKDLTVVKASAEALGKLGDYRSVEPLIAALSLAEAAVRPSSKLGVAPATGTVNSQPFQRKAPDSADICSFLCSVFQALAQIGDRSAVDAIIGAILDSDCENWNFRKWEEGATAIATLGGSTTAFEVLEAALQNKKLPAESRHKIANALCRANTGLVVPSLTRILKSHRWYADRVAKRLLELLTHLAPEISTNSLETLTALGDVTAESPDGEGVKLERLDCSVLCQLAHQEIVRRNERSSD
jgi:HEAT repeat protein